MVDMTHVIVTDEGSPEGDWLRKRISSALAGTLDEEGGDPELAILQEE